MKSKTRKPVLNLIEHRNHDRIMRKRGKISSLRNIRKQKEEFFELCNRCKKLGYCRANSHNDLLLHSNVIIEETTGSRLICYDISKLCDLIGQNDNTYGHGIHTYQRGIFSAKNIRLANEAFHGEAYDNSYAHFKEVADELRDEEALRGVAISLFYMERYDDSVAALEKCNEHMLPEGMKEAFIEAAILRQKLLEISENVQYGLEVEEFIIDDKMPLAVCSNL